MIIVDILSKCTMQIQQCHIGITLVMDVKLDIIVLSHSLTLSYATATVPCIAKLIYMY